MGQMSYGFRPTGPGTNLLPLGSIYAPAGNGIVVREIHAVNTTAVVVALAVQKLTTAGTAPAETGEQQWDDDSPAPTGAVFDTHTVGPTITAGFVEATVLGPVIGSAWVWVFGGRGLSIPPGVANGIGVTIPTDTGQICDLTFVWDE